MAAALGTIDGVLAAPMPSRPAIKGWDAKAASRAEAALRQHFEGETRETA